MTLNLPLKRLLLVVGAAGQSVLELRRFQRLSEARRSTSPAPGILVERLLRLGPLYVKIGQILSTRPDVLPRQHITMLQQLQEHVPPMAFADVEAVIREDFHGKSISDVFSSFDQTPRASASVAQVHFATLKSGEEVAVKVQPGAQRFAVGGLCRHSRRDARWRHAHFH